VLLLAGSPIAFVGPLEVSCFSLFSEGGRFHYEGFGFGSLMFGIIAVQVLAYPLTGAALVVAGCGHLMMRRWARTLVLALLWSWLVVGAPLTAVGFFVLAETKDLSPAGAVAVIVGLGLSYVVLPGLLIRIYRGRDIRLTLEARDRSRRGAADLPVPILVLGCLHLFLAVALGVLLTFRGMVPLFGTFRYGLQGIVMLDVGITCLAGLAVGTLRRSAWAWWGSVVFLGLLTISTVLSFCATGYPAILSSLELPETEAAVLRKLPLRGFHLALLAGLPLLATWGIAVASKRFFGRDASRDAGCDQRSPCGSVVRLGSCDSVRALKS